MLRKQLKAHYLILAFNVFNVMTFRLQFLCFHVLWTIVVHPCLFCNRRIRKFSDTDDDDDNNTQVNLAHWKSSRCRRTRHFDLIRFKWQTTILTGDFIGRRLALAQAISLIFRPIIYHFQVRHFQLTLSAKRFNIRYNVFLQKAVDSNTISRKHALQLLL